MPSRQCAVTGLKRRAHRRSLAASSPLDARAMALVAQQRQILRMPAPGGARSDLRSSVTLTARSRWPGSKPKRRRCVQRSRRVRERSFHTATAVDAAGVSDHGGTGAAPHRAVPEPVNLQQYGQVQEEIGYLMLNTFVHTISGGRGRFPLARIFVMADGQRQTRGVGMPPRVPLGATAAFM